MRVVVIIIWLLLIAGFSGSSANAESRVALVIGNSAYKNAPFLPNPINDATDVSASLQRLGYTVKTLTNANYDDMRRALIDFGRQARGVDLAVIFFAGHGIQMGGENWLIPSDAQLATDLDVANEAISLQAVTRAVSTTTELGLVILDSCRINPFLSKMQSTNVSRAVERGFSRVEPSDNVLVAYSARDGTTARDGVGRNSPFTQSLLKNIETPGLEVRFLFASVRDDVMIATSREQQPFVYGSLSKNLVYLSPPVDRPIQGSPPKTGPAPEGSPATSLIIIPEGLTSEQIIALLQARGDMSGSVTAIPQEGTLLPGSYNFHPGIPRDQFIQDLQRNSQAAVKEIWEQRTPGLPLQTPEQLVILASIVEKETARPNERALVASVFLNRLKAKIKLQSDPTIIYGLVGGKGTLGRPIKRSEVMQPSAYNTFVIDGLPPGPISNPGRTSLEAAANPARTRDLFFSADGAGGHVFTDKYDQLQKNVAKLRVLVPKAQTDTVEW
jgi:hypothetical protein